VKKSDLGQKFISVNYPSLRFFILHWQSGRYEYLFYPYKTPDGAEAFWDSHFYPYETPNGAEAFWDSHFYPYETPNGAEAFWGFTFLSIRNP
jgi:hypothetical protein